MEKFKEYIEKNTDFVNKKGNIEDKIQRYGEKFEIFSKKLQDNNGEISPENIQWLFLFISTAFEAIVQEFYSILNTEGYEKGDYLYKNIFSKIIEKYSFYEAQKKFVKESFGSDFKKFFEEIHKKNTNDLIGGFNKYINISKKDFFEESYGYNKINIEDKIKPFLKEVHCYKILKEGKLKDDFDNIYDYDIFTQNTQKDIKKFIDGNPSYGDYYCYINDIGRNSLRNIIAHGGFHIDIEESDLIDLKIGGEIMEYYKFNNLLKIKKDYLNEFILSVIKKNSFSLIKDILNFLIPSPVNTVLFSVGEETLEILKNNNIYWRNSKKLYEKGEYIGFYHKGKIIYMVNRKESEIKFTKLSTQLQKKIKEFESNGNKVEDWTFYKFDKEDLIEVNYPWKDKEESIVFWPMYITEEKRQEIMDYQTKKEI